MADGYFNDGVAVNIELGVHVFGLPQVARRNLILTPHDAGGVVLDSGGGTHEISVTGQRTRENLGDAERYIYEILVALAGSDAGDLAYEDNRGHRVVFGDAICVSASGEVQAGRFAEIRYEFESPERLSQPAWGAVPTTPGVYAGSDWLQDYAVGGVSLGTGGRMRIEMHRSWPLREMPRARGARATTPYSGAQIRFLVTADQVAGTSNLASALDTVERLIGPRTVDLVANGMQYNDVILDQARPRQTDRKMTEVEFEFVQVWGAGAS